MDYVIFECSAAINSLHDAIQCGGHRLKSIVCTDAETAEAAKAAHPHLQAVIVARSEFTPATEDVYLCGEVGEAALRWRAANEFNRTLPLGTLVHPAAIISPTATLAPGTVVLAGAILASNVVVGEQCLIGQGAIFGHDTVLRNGVQIGAGARLAGHLCIDTGATIELGASVIEDVAIGVDARVRAGAVVLKNIAAGAVVSGVPAKPEAS